MGLSSTMLVLLYYIDKIPEALIPVLRFNLVSVLLELPKVIVENDIVHSYQLHFAPIIYS